MEYIKKINNNKCIYIVLKKYQEPIVHARWSWRGIKQLHNS